MLDQNEGVTEASQQLNASFPANGKLSASLASPKGLNRPNPNIITIDNIAKTTLENVELEALGYLQIDENLFTKIDLEQVFLEAIKIIEKREK